LAAGQGTGIQRSWREGTLGRAGSPVRKRLGQGASPGKTKNLPSQHGDERPTFRGTTRIRARQARAHAPLTVGLRPALAGRSRANQATHTRAAFSRWPPLSAGTRTRYFPVQHISQSLIFIAQNLSFGKYKVPQSFKQIKIFSKNKKPNKIHSESCMKFPGNSCGKCRIMKFFSKYY